MIKNIEKLNLLLNLSKNINTYNLSFSLTILSVILIPIISSNNLIYGLAVPKLLLLLLISASLILLMNIQSQTQPIKITIICLFIWLIMFGILFNSIFSPTVLTSFFGLYSRFQGLLFSIFSMVFFFVGKRFGDKINKIIIPAAITGTIVALVGIFQFWNGLSRVYSTIGNPIYLANYLLLIIPTLIGIIYNESKKIRLFFGALMLYLMIISVILTFSRAAWLGLGVLIITYIASRGMKPIFEKKNVSIIILITCILAIFTTSVLINYQPNQKLVKSNRLGVMNKVDNARLVIWEIAWKQFLKNPLGTGISTFAFTSTKSFSKSFVNHYGPTATWSQAHNEYLQILSEQGLGGIIIFLCMIGALVYGWLKWRRTRERNDVLSGVWAAVFTYLFIISFSFSGIAYTFIFWLFIGFLARNVFDDNGKLHLNINPKIRILFSTIILVSIILFCFFFYQADKDFFKWITLNKIDIQERLVYLNRAVTYAPWEEEYRYRRAQALQMVLQDYQLTREQVTDICKTLINDIDILLKNNPINSQNHALAAETLIIFRDYKNALKNYQEALVLFPNNYEFLSRVGDILVGLEKFDNAKKYYENALEIMPNYKPALSGLENLENLKKDIED